MFANALLTTSQIESSLWQNADQLRANFKLISSDYCKLVLGALCLRCELILPCLANRELAA